MMIVIERMREGDIDQVAWIEDLTFSRPWSAQSFLDSLKNPNTIYLIAKEGGEIVGYIGIWISFGEGEITNVAVSPDWRGKGIGSALLSEARKVSLAEGVEALVLEVRVSTHAAVRLYEKHGFRSVGIRPDFYDEPREDAIIMWNHFL
jgi:ribosomal-protein-alanine N-acetyltransferase